ncbi:MAG: sporulation integral membrane protein YtvI [Lysinibacillus sp.]
MSSIFTKQFLRKPLIIVIILAIILWLLSLAIPILFAYCTALLLEPFITKVCTKVKLRRKFVIPIFFLLFFSLLTLLSSLAFFIFWKQSSAFLLRMPHYMNELSAFWIQLQSKLTSQTYQLPLEIVTNIQTLISKSLVALESFVMSLIQYDYLTSFISSLPDLLFDIIIFSITLYMFLLDLPAINKKLLAPLQHNMRNNIYFIGSKVKLAFIGFFKAQFVIGILIFTASVICFTLLKVPFPVILALVLVILDVIPFLDSFLLLAPWAVYAVLTGQYLMAFSILALALLLFFIRRIIEPKIIGDKVGLSSLTTLISMFIGFKIFGILGILLGPLVIVGIMAVFEKSPLKKLPPTL